MSFSNRDPYTSIFEEDPNIIWGTFDTEENSSEEDDDPYIIRGTFCF